MARDQQERLKKLLDKLNNLNLGGGGWWRPPVGTSTIRVLPGVGSMDYFFVDVGQHYITEGGKPFYCPNITSEGELPCPICQVNEELYAAGEKDAAKKFRAGRAFFMNVIDRSHPDQGVLKYGAGSTIFQAIASAVGDPDYGDISDPDTGYDIKIERTGEGRENTRYQVRPVKRSTPLGDEEQIEVWLNEAQDLKEFVMGELLPFDELAQKSGVDVFFASDGGGEDVADEEPEEAPPPKARSTRRSSSRKPVPEPEEDEDEEPEDDGDEDEEPPARRTVSSQIAGRMSDREKRAKLLRRK